MSTRTAPDLGHALTDLVETALGRAHRHDPVVPRSGGPAGNAQLTAWLGLVLFALFLAELITLFDVRGLITWHLSIGLLLVPPAVAKIATTGWRMLRYYAGAPPYVQAGPPPLLLRMLGPLVVLSTVALLGTGIALVVLGPGSSFDRLIRVAGLDISPLTLHQAAFAAWAVATALHVAARILPAVLLAVETDEGEQLPGISLRALVLVVAVAAAVAAAVLVVALAGDWTGGSWRSG